MSATLWARMETSMHMAGTEVDALTEELLVVGSYTPHVLIVQALRSVTADTAAPGVTSVFTDRPSGDRTHWVVMRLAGESLAYLDVTLHPSRPDVTIRSSSQSDLTIHNSRPDLTIEQCWSRPLSSVLALHLVKLNSSGHQDTDGFWWAPTWEVEIQGVGRVQIPRSEGLTAMDAYEALAFALAARAGA